MFKPVRLIVFLLPVLILATAQAEKVHKWIDSSGTTHYSDRPPKIDIETEVIMSLDEPLELDANKNEESEPSEETPAEGSQEAEASLPPNPEVIAYCEQLKANMATLDGEERVRIQHEDGSFEILGDEGKEREKNRLQEQMTKFCQ